MKRIITLIMMLSLIGCSTVQENKNNSFQSINSVVEVANIEYNLTNIFPGQGLTVGFDQVGRIYGYSGLNRFFGKVKITNGNIEVEQLASTKMSGAREDLIREEQYLTLLKSMTKISRKENSLILSNEKGEELIYFGK